MSDEQKRPEPMANEFSRGAPGTVSGVYRFAKAIDKRQKLTVKAVSIGGIILALLGALSEAGVFQYLRYKLDNREPPSREAEIQRLAKEIAKELRNHE